MRGEEGKGKQSPPPHSPLPSPLEHDHHAFLLTSSGALCGCSGFPLSSVNNTFFSRDCLTCAGIARLYSSNGRKQSEVSIQRLCTINSTVSGTARVSGTLESFLGCVVCLS